MIDYGQLRYYNQLPYILRKDQFEIQENDISEFLVDCKNNILTESIIQIDYLIQEIGFAIVEFDAGVGINQIAESLECLFGELMTQTRDPSDTIYDVEYNPDKIKNNLQLNSNRAQPLHTDGHFQDRSPQYIGLYCKRNSQMGGYSQIVRAQDIHDYIAKLSPKTLEELFETDSLTFTRRQPGGKGLFVYEKPLFFARKDGKIGINYNPIMRQIEGKSTDVENALKLINYFTNNPKNQTVFKLKPGQILLADNTQVLHGRTAFPNGDKRVMQRLWFEGQG